MRCESCTFIWQPKVMSARRFISGYRLQATGFRRGEIPNVARRGFASRDVHEGERGYPTLTQYTEHGAWFTTFAAVVPIIRCTAPWPCVPTTTASAFVSLATSHKIC